MLKQINAKLERQNQYQQEQINEHYKCMAILRKENIAKAHEIVRNQDNPVEKIVEAMHYGFPSETSCSFCDIFKLYERDCLLEYHEQKGVTLQNACETCIGRFLYDYYQSNPQTGHP